MKWPFDVVPGVVPRQNEQAIGFVRRVPLSGCRPEEARADLVEVLAHSVQESESVLADKGQYADELRQPGSYARYDELSTSQKSTDSPL